MAKLTFWSELRQSTVTLFSGETFHDLGENVREIAGNAFQIIFTVVVVLTFPISLSLIILISRRSERRWIANAQKRYEEQRRRVMARFPAPRNVTVKEEEGE